jgi:hypothetical protein
MRGALTVAVAVLLLPGVAGAVVLDLTVTGAEEPVTLNLTEVDGTSREVTTDATGRATVDVKPGLVEIQPRGDQYVRERQTVIVPPTGPSAFTIPVRPVQPWMVQNPAGVLGGVGVGLGYEGRWLDGLDITVDTATVTNRLDGQVVETDTIRNDPRVSNQKFQVDLDMNTGFLDIPIGLPRVQAGPVALYPAVAGLVGWSDFELTFRDRQTGVETRFDGDGVVLGAALELLVVPCPEPCPWFAAVGFGYRTDVDTDVDRSPRLSEPGFDFADSVELGFESWTVSARGGYVVGTGLSWLRSVAPWVGLQYDSTDVTLDGRIVTTAPRFPGASSTTEFRNEFETESVQGMVGADVHFFDRLFGRFMVVFDDCNVGVQTKLVYAFGF